MQTYTFGAKHPHPCAKCGGALYLRSSKRSGLFYGCGHYPACQGRARAHQRDGRPTGIPANAEIRYARRIAHGVFDQLWKRQLMTRREAYTWLTQLFGAREEMHIGMMSLEDCRFVIKAVQRYLKT